MPSNLNQISERLPSANYEPTRKRQGSLISLIKLEPCLSSR